MIHDKIHTINKFKSVACVQECIAAAVRGIERSILLNLWTELDHRWDVYWVTENAQIEICNRHKKFGECMYLFIYHTSLHIAYL